MIAFALLAAVAVFLAAASLLPDGGRLYTSLSAVVLWAAVAVTASVVIIRRRLWRRTALFVLHASFLLILAGALITHLTSDSCRLHLLIGESVQTGHTTIRLDDFDIEYYPGTSAPSDFVAYVSIGDSGQQRISMNRVASDGGMRFFLTSCDQDRRGCTFTVTSDSAGTAVTYVGYALLLLSMLACSIPVGARRWLRLSGVAALVLFCAGQAAATPRVLPREVAGKFGELCVYHNDRVAPLSTLAREFSLKIYGTASYCGLTPEQVLTGWLFYYDDWKTDRGIKIKDSATLRVMDAADNRVALIDFFGSGGYLFDDPAYPEANEKFALVSGAAAGSLWKIFPYAGSDGSVEWFTPVSSVPADMDLDRWRMTRHSLGYVAELVAASDWEGVTDAICKIGRYQSMQCPGALPSPMQRRAEEVFMTLSGNFLPCAVMLFGGLVLLLFPCVRAARCLSAVSVLWIALLMVLNTFVSRHLPMSNGYETMQWMALSALLITLWLGHRQAAFIPAGIIVAALALAVAFMGQRNPQLTNLMPVLRSPLLSIHVLTVMLAYALLAVVSLASAMWLCGRRAMLPLARRMLRPAVFMLTAGIFTGAVWANMSWGRYWGWDPKEVWALITMIVYSFPLHCGTLPMFRRDRTFAIWTLVSFSTVIMTYLGVNFFLGGLHSYA